MGVTELRNDHGVLVGVGKSSFGGILCKWGMDYLVKGFMKGRFYTYTRRRVKLRFSLHEIRTCVGWTILGKNKYRRTYLLMQKLLQKLMGE